MRKDIADQVLANSLEVLCNEPDGKVVTSVQPKPGSDPEQFQVVHSVYGSRYAQFIQMLLSQVDSKRIQRSIERECVCSEKDVWIIRQDEFNVVEAFSSHVCDSLFGVMSAAEAVDDENWAAQVRCGLGEAYPGQMRLFLGISPSAGREIVVWGIPGEAHAKAVHFFLLHRFSEMHLGIHFDSAPLARLESKFRSSGWIAAVREH
ncbi:MAG: hypothetical protein U0136_21095 [Bdellovibrionota bacterium]